MLARLIDSATVLTLGTALLYLLGLTAKHSILYELGLPLTFLDTPEVVLARGLRVLLEIWRSSAVVVSIGIGMAVCIDRLVRRIARVRSAYLETGRQIRIVRWPLLLLGLAVLLAYAMGRAWFLGKQEARRLTYHSFKPCTVELDQNENVEGQLYDITDDYVVLITPAQPPDIEIKLLPKVRVSRVIIRFRMEASR